MPRPTSQPASAVPVESSTAATDCARCSDHHRKMSLSLAEATAFAPNTLPTLALGSTTVPCWKNPDRDKTASANNEVLPQKRRSAPLRLPAHRRPSANV